MPSKSTQRNPLLIPLMVVFTALLIVAGLLVWRTFGESQADDELTSLRTALTESTAKVEILEAELTAAWMKLAEAESAAKANAAQTAQLAALTEEKSSLEAQLTTLQTGYDALTANFTEQATQIATLTEEKAALEAQLTAAQKQIAEASSTAEANTSQVAELTAQVATLTEEKTALEAQLATLQSEYTALTATSAEQATQIATLTEEKAALEAQFTAAQKQLAEASSMAETNTSQVDELTAQVTTLTEEKSALEAENALLAAANESLVAELGSISANLTATQNALHAAVDEATEARALLLAAQGKSASAKGYGGLVTVTAVVDDQGAILFLSVDAPDETALDARFVEQLRGRTLPITLGEGVDAVAGATVTCQAVVEALNLLTPEYATPHDDLPTAE